MRRKKVQIRSYRRSVHVLPVIIILGQELVQYSSYSVLVRSVWTPGAVLSFSELPFQNSPDTKLTCQHYSGFWTSPAFQAHNHQSYQSILHSHQAIWHWCYCRYRLYSRMSSCALFSFTIHFINGLNSFSLRERPISPTPVLVNCNLRLPRALSRLLEFSYPSSLNISVIELSYFVPKRCNPARLPQVRRN